MVKAIETKYAGRKFRSRNEARWAVVFDALNMNWDYEPEGFTLPSGKRYLPDFRITSNEGSMTWLEVKPNRNTVCTKFEEFKTHTPEPAIIIGSVSQFIGKRLQPENPFFWGGNDPTLTSGTNSTGDSYGFQKCAECGQWLVSRDYSFCHKLILRDIRGKQVFARPGTPQHTIDDDIPANSFRFPWPEFRIEMSHELGAAVSKGLSMRFEELMGV